MKRIYYNTMVSRPQTKTTVPLSLLTSWQVKPTTTHNDSEFEQIENALFKSEEKYETLFNSIDEGFCIIEVLFNANQHPVDYRFIETNAAFERQTGITNALGRRMREIAPAHEEYWFEIYGKVALTGEPIRFENYAKQLNHWYEVYAFRSGEPEEHHVAILFKDINERKTMERLKDEFISIAGHELRTPLTGVKAYTDLLKRQIAASNLSGDIPVLADKLSTQVTRLTNLVNNLLDATKISEDTLILTKERFDLNELIIECITAQPPSTKQRLVFESSDVSPILADRERIAEVLTNIISNAIKYSRPDGTITVRTALDGAKRVKISVQDKGVGIHKNYSDKIFNRFFRVDNANMPNHAGLGLGLYVCAEIIKRHGGSIGVESVPNKGAIFSFTLPYDM